MYASNEDEDWIYLHETLRADPILQKPVNLMDSEDSSSSSITSCSSTSSSSSKSSRSVSLSSISSAEIEILKNNSLPSSLGSVTNCYYSEDEIQILKPRSDENPLFFDNQNDNIHTMNTHHQFLSHELLSTNEDKSTLPCQSLISHENDDSTLKQNLNISQTMDENHILNAQMESNRTPSLTNSSFSSNESFSSIKNLRNRRSSNIQQTTRCEMIQSIPMSKEIKERKIYEFNEHKNNKLTSFIYIILFLSLPFMLGHVITRWDQSAISKLVEELVKVNQRLNNVRNIPIINIEGKLTKQIDEKLQHIIQQQSVWHDHEKDTLNVQVQELQEIVKMTQQNLTDTIHQLTEENVQLKEQIKSLEIRLYTNQKQESNYLRPCIEGVNCTTSTLNKVVSDAFMAKDFVPRNTSSNLSGIFEYLSTRFSNFVSYRYEYLKKTKRKLSNIVSSSAVRTSLLRGLENLSLSFHKTKLTYFTWLKSRAKDYEPNQIKNNVKEKLKRVINRKIAPRWVFQYRFNRQRKWYQSKNKEHICRSKFNFPMNKICLIKNWITKFF